MEYAIAEARDEAANLGSKVNEYIKDGWKPIGGVTATYLPGSGKWRFYQAMVRTSSVASGNN